MLVDATRLSQLLPEALPYPGSFERDRFRRRVASFQDNPGSERSRFVSYILDSLCGWARAGQWTRGSNIDADLWTRKTLTGEIIKPHHLWQGPRGALLPVFIDKEARIGIGRGKRVVADALQWLRTGDPSATDASASPQSLALITNGFQWRLAMAGMDYDAYCQWDVERWLEGGETTDELGGFCALFDPELWIPPAEGAPCSLLAAVHASRKGQAELSQVLGERVRQAVELLIQAHSPLLDSQPEIGHQDVYRAAVRLIMRMVVVLFAESREGLLPRDNPVYHAAYSLQGLRDQLERTAPVRRRHGYAAYPRLVSLFRLIHQGSSHEGLPVPTYGGQLFQPGDDTSNEPVRRALEVLENGCFQADIISDETVRTILDLLSRTRVKIRQGRSAAYFPSPVDFSSLDSEYIGILYEGLLDFELRVAPVDNPIIFLAVGNQPALPLSTLQMMDDRALKNLLDKLKDTSSGGDDEADEASDDEPSDELDSDSAGESEVEDLTDDEDGPSAESEDTSEGDEANEVEDARQTTRAAAHQWARRAIEIGRLVRRPAGQMTPERRMQHEAAIDRKARQIITRVVLPGERYLVRWGGTRKGSGTFYTRPQLAVPTVHRTLEKLVMEEEVVGGLGRVAGKHGEGAVGSEKVAGKQDSAGEELRDRERLGFRQIPKTPEEILNLKVCDPACGSGSFPLAALRYLTGALYESLIYHNRIKTHEGKSILELIQTPTTTPQLQAATPSPPATSHRSQVTNSPATSHQSLATEHLPCRPEDPEFESRTKAVLRRYIVERCIYGVDLDPLAVELCRLSLWIETLDPRLPFTFLDHKIKCGNSLVGTWFDQFMHYPAMAWMREGGDKSHTGGVHYKKEAWTKAISKKVKDIRQELMDYIDGVKLLYPKDLTSVQSVHQAAEQALQAIHQLGIHEASERAERYQQLVKNPAYRELKRSFDLWCAIWFWPPD